MKKKEIVVHMTAPKERRVGFFKRIQLVPALLCLLAAVLIWLFVVNLGNRNAPDLFSVEETEVGAGESGSGSNL